MSMMMTGRPSSFTSDAAQQNTAARRPFAATPPPMPTPRAPSALRRAARTEDAAEDATEVEVIVKADMVSEDR